MDRPNVQLGNVVRDNISGFQGVAVCLSNWLNGCQRVTIQPQTLKEDGSILDNHTCDAEQVEVIEGGALFGSSATGGPSIAPVQHPDPI